MANHNYGPKAQAEIYQEVNIPESSRLPISYEEWEYRASRILDKGAFDYAAGGAGEEHTLRANVRAFKKWDILPNLLVDVSKRDLTVSLFGKNLPSPILLGPAGRQELFNPNAELASARAAASLGVPFTLSTVSARSIEEVAAVMGNSPRWFQLFWGADLDVTGSMLRRAEAAGYSAIVVSLDRPLIGWRERDLRNAYFPLMFGRAVANFLTDPVFLAKYNKSFQGSIETAVKKVFEISYNPGLTWEDLKLLRNYTKLPILIKGIVHPNDAEKAVQNGIDGIIVSNHGGRHLDGAIASIDALPVVCNVIRNRIPVLFDSGIRRGPDVVKALSLGASAVLIGKLYIYGLAVAGEAGVKRVIKNLIADTDLTMANAGRRSIAELDRTLLVQS